MLEHAPEPFLAPHLPEWFGVFGYLHGLAVWFSDDQLMWKYGAAERAFPMRLLPGNAGYPRAD
jgi:hypothetical protein